MNTDSIIFDTDSYKYSHWLQYPQGTQTVFSYLESRGGEFPATLFFGLQMYLKKYLCKQIQLQDILLAEKIVPQHGLDFNKDGWMHILKKHNGYLPLKIRAVPEGEVVPVSNSLVTIENTDPECYWLTNFVETSLLRVWYPITVATLSFYIKKYFVDFLLETSDNLGVVDFMLHDFGSRGVSSKESSGVGGAAHLVNFKGTDNIQALLYAMKYYNSDIPGFSIPAAEHSTITSWGRKHERDAFENMIKQYAKPGKMFAVVSDSWDIHKAVQNLWGRDLKQQVINSAAKVIVRPDSGKPEKVSLEVLASLMNSYGCGYNSKGYAVLPDCIGVIQGDGVDKISILTILEEMKNRKMSAENIAFGMGGALLQRLDRDTQQFAFKCSAIERDGIWRDVYKEPVSDSDMSFKKRSKKGRMTLIYDNVNKQYKTVHPNEVDKSFHASGKDTWKNWDVMETVFENGVLKKEYTFEQIRNHANSFHSKLR